MAESEYPNGGSESEVWPRQGMSEIVTLYDNLKAKFADRQREIAEVRAAREGRMNEVSPDLFPMTGPFSKAIVANMIDVAARDLSEMLAPLPSFNCSPMKSSNPAAKRSELRTKIGSYYLDFSRAQIQNYDLADDYFSAGIAVGMVEVDADERMPRIMHMPAEGFYPVYNRWKEIIAGFFTFHYTKDDLTAKYPKAATQLGMQSGNALIEVARYHDEYVDMLFLPHGQGPRTPLMIAKNPVGECLIEIAKRPGLGDKPRSQFADSIAVQVAKSRFALLGLEAATKAVQAPIAVPNDMNEMQFGPDAMIRTNSPEKVRRVEVNVPASTFAEQQLLEDELLQGARYSKVRTGQVGGSTVTGKGVDALNGAFDTQIRTGQSMFATMWMNLMRKAFMVDEKLFGGARKSVSGSSAGVPFQVEYDPSEAIKGDYSVDVQYGLMAGLLPNQALVFGLQAQGAGYVSSKFMMEQMPFTVNPTEMQQDIDVENLRKSLGQAVAGYAQSIPALAQSGGDPSVVLAKVAQIIKDRQGGKALELAVSDAFTPEPTPEAAPDAAGVVDPNAPPADGGQLGGGLQPSGLMRGVAPGQQGLPPGGRPDIASLFAGISPNGKANLGAAVKRQIPIQ